MKYLVFFALLVVLIGAELTVFTSGTDFGRDIGYHQGFDEGYTTGVVDERDHLTSFVLDRMAFYESTYNVNRWGDFDGTRYLAYGLYQFHRPTFMWLARLSGNARLNWKNPEHQYQVTKWAIRHGYGFLWSSYRLALHDYFVSVQDGGQE